MSSSRTRYLRITALLALLIFVWPPSWAAAQTALPDCTGEVYTVRAGDTWNTVSQQAGATVAALQQLNPGVVRPNGWLWIGDLLCLPAAQTTVTQATQAPTTPAPAAGGYWYQVRPGDTWNTVSRATGVAVRELWRANPALVDRLYWLYIGQRVWVPSAAAAPAAEAGAPATPAPAATVAPAATATPAPTATATPAPAAQAAPATATPAALADGCAATLAGYPDLILAYLNTPNNQPAGLKAWLEKCNAITSDPDAVTLTGLQSASSVDVIVALHDPAFPPSEGSGMLLIYHSSPAGYKLAYKAASAGNAALLIVSDLNADKKLDVVWTDTSCGAHTCFTTLNVNSWDGAAYADWIEGEPTIASAEYRFQDTTADGSGQELIIYGGVIGSAGAGPQRAWTETYTSAKGAPYALFSLVYDASSCLYHAILDANAAFDAWTREGFDPAIDAYTAAIDDQTLAACGSLANELPVLRDFARFRLTVALVGSGQQAKAQAVLSQITNPAVRGAANTFYTAYRSSGSVIQACRDTNKYALATPGSWQFLADWGYANPSFVAEDLCPLR